MNLEDISYYLPRYLSADSNKELFDCLRSFDGRVDSRVYSNKLYNKNTLFQGDGIKGLPQATLPSGRIGQIPAIILSNTCDIAPENTRLFSPSITFAPIFKLENFINMLRSKGKPEPQILTFVENAKKQILTSILYLPVGEGIEQDSIVLFDKISHCNYNDVEYLSLPESKLFTLSDFGFYLFLFKLSVHFTRIKERVDRFKGVVY